MTSNNTCDRSNDHRITKYVHFVRNMPTIHTLVVVQVVFLLLSNYVILQEASRIETPGTIELCEGKEDTQISRTFSLLTSLLWNKFNNSIIRKPEQGSELHITFYHKLNLPPFLTDLIKNKASWNIEIQKGIWMKVRLSGTQIDEVEGITINANKIRWQYKSFKSERNVWDQSCILIFNDYGREPRTKWLLEETIKAFLTTDMFRDLTLPSRIKKKDSVSKNETIDRQARNIYYTPNLNLKMNRAFLSQQNVEHNIQLIVKLLVTNLNATRSFFNDFISYNNNVLYDNIVFGLENFAQYLLQSVNEFLPQDRVFSRRQPR